MKVCHSVIRTFFLFACLFPGMFPLSAQIRLKGVRQEDIASRFFTERWPAYWISAPGATDHQYNVCHFRKSFTLSERPEKFIVHVSADNRYKLYVNGCLASLGPACGDVLNWNFETVDLAPYLKEGKNTVAAVVWNFANWKPVAQISSGRTAFILQGNDEPEEILNTDSSWSSYKNESYSPHQLPVSGYYAAGACEKIDAARYPWGWEQTEYDDSSWGSAVKRMKGAMKGAIDYPGWQLVPRSIPHMEMTEARIPVLRKADGLQLPAGFPARREPLTFPPHTTAELLLDNEVLTTGYPHLLFNRGKDAVVQIGYAEALYEDTISERKGNRNEIEGKHFIGYEDLLLPDGGMGRSFTPLWWRTWRYIRIRVKTKDEPLMIEDLYATTSMYPFVRESEFHSDDPLLDDILETGWRTARLCAHESYMDCPYYEQLQYFGDTRIQSLITLFNTRDDRLVRNALEQGRQSLVPDGITMSRYPSEIHQFIPPFSLWWICMGHDYWMYRGNETYLKTLLPAYRSILSWFEQYLKTDYSLGRIPYWFFADWSGTPFGEPVRETEGNSAFQDLLYVIALQSAAEMEMAFGSKATGEHQAELAREIRQTMREKYWNTERKLFADTYGQYSFSQHVNVLAILAGVVEGEDASVLLQSIVNDETLLPCTIYFRYYLQVAMKQTGNGHLLLDNLQLWKDQLALGLTTWAERPEPSRSDCHAWGASHNIEFYRTVLGIESAAPGFRRIRIEPAPGTLKEASGTVPHPDGEINVRYRLTGKNGIRAEIEIPAETAGTFVWNGVSHPLTGGKQIVNILESNE